MDHDEDHSPPSLSELPNDELVQYGRALGLALTEDSPRGEALRLIRQRQELLVELDRDALLDVVMWLRVPVRRSAGKEHLAKIISANDRLRYEGLSERGLHALARLSGVEPLSGEPRVDLERRVRKAVGFGARFRRMRRRLIGAVAARLLTQDQPRDESYKFLPEDAKPTLKDDIEHSGLVGGVARKLRDFADDYVAEKLDDIERRIDCKLDEIDQRLCEWRDRELLHRFRIIKITLIASIIVAVLSLLYDYLRDSWGGAGAG